MRITVENANGTLIDENHYATDNATEALRMYLDKEHPILADGDVIKISETYITEICIDVIDKQNIDLIKIENFFKDNGIDVVSINDDTKWTYKEWEEI